MKKLFRIIALASILSLVFTSCENEQSIDGDKVSIKLVSAPVVYVDGDEEFELVYEVTPENLLKRKGVTVGFVSEFGYKENDFFIKDTKDEGNGRWKLTCAFKYESTRKRDIRLSVVYGKDEFTSDVASIRRMILIPDSVVIGGQSATLDEETSTYTAILPTTTDFSDMTVYLSFDGDSATDGTHDLLDGSCQLDLSKPLTITLTMGGKSKEYTIIAKNTGLPVVRINTPDKKAITSKDVWMEGADMVIDYPDGTRDYEGTLSIRGRGNSTWNYVKKPYALKLDKKSKVLGMPKHKRWVLLANWKDRTIMRNDAAFWLSRQTSLPYTVRGQFVELVLNGKHIGNYYLCEQIKIDDNRVAITEMDPNETDPEKITGGYLLELDTYFDEVNKFRSPRFNLPYQIKQPDETELSAEAKSYIINYVTELENLLKDETRVKNHEYEQYLDVDSAIEFMFVEELTNNTDFYNSWPSIGPHSCYLYKDRGGKLFHGPLWDFDYHGFVPSLSQQWAGANKTIYYPALLKDEKFRNRMLELWEKDKAKFEKLPDYIDQKADEIRLSEGYNHNMWPINTNSENGDEKMTFDAAIERIKLGFTTKLAWMDRHLKELK